MTIYACVQCDKCGTEHAEPTLRAAVFEWRQQGGQTNRRTGKATCSLCLGDKKEETNASMD